MMSRRLGSICGWIAAVWLAVAIPRAAANGFPDFDPARETVLAGRATPRDTAKQAKATTAGTWKLDDHKLVVEGKGNRFWVASAPSVADGLVRVRVEPGKRLDGGLLFRVEAPKPDVRELSGYELTWDNDAVRLHRWDRGFALPVGDEVKLKKLGRHDSIEIVVVMVGPQIVVTIYDGETLAPITTLAAHETTYAAGRVGVRAGAKQEGAKIALLSAMDTRASAPKPKGSGKHGALRLYGLDRDPGTTPFGNTRFVVLRKDDVNALPRELRKIESTFRDADGVTKAVVFANTVGFERIKRSGVDVLAADSNVPWKLLDAAYRSRRDRKPTPKGRGFRLDQSYKNPQMIEDLLRAYQAKYPAISKLVELGRTHQGRAIWGLEISDHPGQTEAEPSVLFDGGHHASELLAVEYPLDAMAQLLEGYGRDKTVTRWVDGLHIFVVPLVNPDGNHMFIEESRFAGRKNARDSNLDGFHDPFEGVDLARNYPFGWGRVGSSGIRSSNYYRGPHEGSEPETMAMMELAAAQHFAAAISFHTIGTAIFTPYNVAGAKEPDPDVAFVVAMELSGEADVQASGRPFAVKDTGYPVAGSDQDWLMHEFGTLAYVLEGSHHNPPMSVRTRSVALTRKAWQTLLERVLAGTRISGHVKDSAGKPVVAEVSIEEVQLRADEHWNTRASDGRFDRVVVGPGTYTLGVRAKGYAPVTQKVRVRSKPVELAITLRRAE
jgi:hypothetical protein